ncbi:hypothetical protein AVEN_152680-1 [Araneus ventricosus]|uniref:Uncharacterized protein n=1 Tax=Araneus ventricosus TaxID=182803 RepID=A0A4Y2HWC8_ARAVE|nr:hypothetical protein AVEN_152680-1 [Araneus ventricosus]
MFVHSKRIRRSGSSKGTNGFDFDQKERIRRNGFMSGDPIYPDSNISLQQACHKFVMTRVQACSKLTKASKSPWNELAASLPQACRANSLQIIAKTEYEYNPG